VAFRRDPLSDFGGIGFEFDTTVVKPLFDGLREKGEAVTSCQWLH
jgi:hypothetical protein